MVGVEILQKHEPVHKPGYTGYCPQYRHICGENYGNFTSTSLLDPNISHAEKLVLVDNAKNNEVVKPTKAELEIVGSREDRTDPVYKYPMLSTYDGFVPNREVLRDKPFGTQAIMGIANFEKQQLNRKKSFDRLRKVIDLQSGSKVPENLEDRLLLKSKFQLPLIVVRPERVGLQRCQPTGEKYEKPKDYNTSPYFMINSNPEKYFKNGYTGYRPYRSTHFGKTHEKMTSDALREFTSNYLNKKITEWAPISITSKKTKITHVPPNDSRIYRKDTAIMPTYTGYIPGAAQKIGKTYGYTSRQANQYLEEHLFNLKLDRECSKKEKSIEYK